MTLKINAKYEEKLIFCFKNDKSLVNFNPSNQKSKKFTLWLIREKYVIFDLKKYSGGIFYDTREWCKIWGKFDFWFGKWHEDFGKFSPGHMKVSKLGLSLDPFIQSRECMSLKLTGESRVETTKNDSKFEKELTCQLKIAMRNLANFDRSTQKSQQFAL